MYRRGDGRMRDNPGDHGAHRVQAALSVESGEARRGFIREGDWFMLQMPSRTLDRSQESRPSG
jgi:hypothetical protein